MASVIAGTFGSSVYAGLKNEWNVMSRDPTPLSLKRVGHGFKAFGEGFANDFVGKDHPKPKTKKRKG